MKLNLKCKRLNSFSKKINSEYKNCINRMNWIFYSYVYLTKIYRIFKRIEYHSTYFSSPFHIFFPFKYIYKLSLKLFHPTTRFRNEQYLMQKKKNNNIFRIFIPVCIMPSQEESSRVVTSSLQSRLSSALLYFLLFANANK